MKTKKLFPYAIGLTLLTMATIFLGLTFCSDYFDWIRRRLYIQSVPPQIAPPVGIASGLEGFLPDNIQSSVEIAFLPSLEDSATVVDIAQNIETNDMLAIYTNGNLLRWNLKSKENIKVYDFGTTATKISANFSADGSRVILPGKIDGDDIYGLSLWDTEQGKRIDCVGEHCPASHDSSPTRFLYLDPLGVWEFGTIGDGMLTIDPINNPDVPSVGAHYSDCTSRSSSEDNTLKMQRITIDSSDTYIAYMFDNGIVCVKELSGWTGIDLKSWKEIDYPLAPYKVIRYRLPGDKVISRDLIMDPTHTWLSVLTDKEMVVWNLQRLMFARQLKISVNDGNVIAFDRDGKLLALGTKSGVTIYDVEQAEKIAEFKVGEVTAIYFTHDNRLLAWSDSQGHIHLWGVSQK